VGKKTHDLPLGRGQVHFIQCPGNGLVGTPVQDAGLVPEMSFQWAHLQIGSMLKCSLLLNIIAMGYEKVKGNLQSLQAEEFLL